jgi:hypothetical protein
MKMTLLVALIALSNSTFANSKINFNIDDIDTISLNNKTILVEDLRDGFETLTDVSTTNNQVSVPNDSKVQITFKNGRLLNFAAAIRVGGDGGGG